MVKLPIGADPARAVETLPTAVARRSEYLSQVFACPISVPDGVGISEYTRLAESFGGPEQFI